MRSEAIVFTGPGKVAIEEVEIPDVGPADVLVEVEYSSISTGTERWCLTGRLKGACFPFIPGYQAAGIIKEVGDEVTDVVPGDRVFSYGGNFDEKKYGGWGGHMKFNVTGQKGVIKLPAEVSTRTASGLVLAQVGYNGASRPQINNGDVALVIGDGLVGQYSGQVLRGRGAEVIMAGHHAQRLKMAAIYSADWVIDSNDEDFCSVISDKYPKGIPITVETVGKMDLVRKAVSLLQQNGQFVLLGYYPEGDCFIDAHWIRARETTVYCPNGYKTTRMDETLGLIVIGQIAIEELVTHEFKYTNAPEAYKMIEENEIEFLGIILNWKN